MILEYLLNILGKTIMYLMSEVEMTLVELKKSLHGNKTIPLDSLGLIFYQEILQNLNLGSK